MIFEALYVIKVRNVDLKTGLNIVDSISKEFNVHSIFIKRVWETSQSPLIEGGQIEDHSYLRFEGVAYA
jgi:hypothetical protein